MVQPNYFFLELGCSQNLLVQAITLIRVVLYQGSPEKQNQQNVYICTKTEIYYKELAHALTEADESELCNVAQQAGDAGELMVQTESKGSWLENLLLLFILVSASKLLDEAHPCYVGQSTLLKCPI